MSVHALTSQAPLMPVANLQHAEAEKSSLCGRCFSPNWNKVTLFINTAAIIAGIAVAYFLKLPSIMIGLGIYGVIYISLYALARRTHIAAAQRAGLLQTEKTTLETRVSDLSQSLESERGKYAQLEEKNKDFQSKYGTLRDADQHLEELEAKKTKLETRCLELNLRLKADKGSKKTLDAQWKALQEAITNKAPGAEVPIQDLKKLSRKIAILEKAFSIVRRTSNDPATKAALKALRGEFNKLAEAKNN